jgi:hypothetical protein
MLAKAVGLSAAPFAAVFAVLLIGISTSGLQVPATLAAAAAMVLSFGGSLNASAGGIASGVSGSAGVSVTIALLSIPVVILFSQWRLHQRVAVPAEERTGYAAAAAVGSILSIALLSFAASGPVEVVEGLDFLSGDISMSMFVPAVLAGAMAWFVAWPESVTRHTRRLSEAFRDLAAMVRVGLGLIAVAFIGLVVAGTWLVFQDALGKQDTSLGALLGALGGFIVAVPNIVVSGIALLLGTNVTGSAVGTASSSYGWIEESGSERWMYQVNIWLQMAFIVLLGIAFVLRRKNPSPTRWWENAIVFGAAGLITAFVTQGAIDGNLEGRFSLIGEIGGVFRAQAGFDYGIALLRFGLAGALLGTLSHPAVVKVTEPIVEQSGIRRFPSAIRESLSGLTGLRDRLPGPVAVRNVAAGAIALTSLWLLASITGSAIAFAGRVVTDGPDDKAAEVAVIFESGSGQEARDLFGLSYTPISSEGVGVTVKELDVSDSSASFLFTLTGIDGLSAERTFTVYKSWPSEWYALWPSWSDVRDAQLPTVSSSGSGYGTIRIGSQTLNEQSIPLMPGTHRIEAEPINSKYFTGRSTDLEVIVSTGYDANWRITPDGEKAAVDVVKSELDRCTETRSSSGYGSGSSRSSGSICPGGKVVSYPTRFSTELIGDNQVLVTTPRDGKYSYSYTSSFLSRSSTTTYESSFGTSAIVEFFPDGSVRLGER